MLENERFCVPEVLFQPQIIGLNQSGLAETIGQALDKFQHLVR